MNAQAFSFQMDLLVCYSITSSPAQTVGPMSVISTVYHIRITLLSDSVSSIIIGNQAINLYGGPEASVECES